jgi:dTDP-4-dehydrorhamnose reductase
MKIVILGAEGQVGWELQRSLSFFGDVSAFKRSQADFTKPDDIVALLNNEQPNIVVNAAANTAVDAAETDAGNAHKINAGTVSSIAKTCSELGAVFIHYSTDYVFDGLKSGFYVESDRTSPLSVYGASKLAGEAAITDSGSLHFIFRTSWVYAARGNNFIKTMLKLASEKNSLSVVDDQFGAPTSAELIADITALVVARIKLDDSFAKNYSGIYHLVAADETTWFGLARYVIGLAESLGLSLQVAAEDIKPIPTSAYPRPATRPVNSRLNTEKLSNLLNITLPTWKLHVHRMVREYLEDKI